MGEAPHLRRLTARGAFVLFGGAVLLVLLFVLVIQPAIERGGWGELALVAGVFAAVLLGERWLRTR